MEKRSSSNLAEWLDGLSRESWQLELIISGFAIFLLLGVYEPLYDLRDAIQRIRPSWQLQLLIGTPYMIATGAWFILLINLCIHVMFRGLWISTIGLRSVSDDIDFDALNLHPRFDQFLRRRIGSFDRYIERLERICSVLFAFTFLILFMLLAFGGMILLMGLVNIILRNGLKLESHWLVSLVNGLFIIGGILYFLDFVTLSRLKRIGWLRPVYYPVYRFFGLVTFATLYRPLYYNLIDNRFGRGVSLLLLPYVIFLLIASSLVIKTDTYFPGKATAVVLNTDYYDDQFAADGLWDRPSISSRYTGNGFVELFIPYLPDQDDRSIQAHCPDLEIAQNTGIMLEGVVNINVTRSGINTDSLLLCMGQIHRVYVDDSLYAPVYHFYTHSQRKDNGLLTVLDVAYLPRGEHRLQVESQRLLRDSLQWLRTATIPFWKE